MVYVAIENVGPYKKGEVVPDGQAVVWMGMYDFPPVKLVEDGEEISGLKSEPEPKSEPELKPEPKPNAKAASETFEKELTSIKGVGNDTASDILKVFPAKELLVNAIKKGEQLPFRNDVVSLLKKKFSKPE